MKHLAILRQCILTCALTAFATPLVAPWVSPPSLFAQEPTTLRIGMIGLDTSHAPAFTKAFNTEDATGNLSKMKVVAAFPGGSDDIASSYERVDGFTKQLRELGVEIVGSVDELLTKVDAVLLESVDGRKHLEQALPVFKSGKPVFIDKPLAGQLVDAIAIDLLAKQYNARWFSSSSLRFSPTIIRFRDDEDLASQIRGASSWGPCSLEPTHSDLYWYGVHGVETLYTAMGIGCESVIRLDGEDIMVIGKWKNGRIGTFRGILSGKKDYGLTVFAQKEINSDAKYAGYQPLVEKIAGFFLGDAAPVANEETIEMFTFMEASDVSESLQGAPVSLAEIRTKATEAARKKIANLAQ